MKTLLVDGDNLLTIGFYALKNYFYKGDHIGGIFHFLNTLRYFFKNENLDKIVVFWDGEDNSIQRRKIYHKYKENGGKNKNWTETEKENYNYQKYRIQQYLEELYVRQGEFKYCESDDCIAYYVQNSPAEEKIIFSSDRDLAQLINDNTKLYNPRHKIFYGPGDMIEYDHENVLIENVKIIKMICGDSSDNIYGIKNLGIKKLINFYPEIKTEQITLDKIKEKSNMLFEENKNNKTLQNILSGTSKLGVLGDEFYIINEKIIELSNPFLTEEAKEDIINLIYENLDTEGRSYKNTMKMMMKDGIFSFLPKSDDAWLNFLMPFLKLTRKEKNKHIIKKRKY